MPPRRTVREPKPVPEADPESQLGITVSKLMHADQALERIKTEYDDLRGMLLGLLPVGNDTRVGKFIAQHIPGTIARSLDGDKWREVLREHNLDPTNFEKHAAEVRLQKAELEAIISLLEQHGHPVPPALKEAAVVTTHDLERIISLLRGFGDDVLEKTTVSIEVKRSHIRTRWENP